MKLVPLPLALVLGTFAVSFPGAVAAPAGGLAVTVENTGGLARPSEVISVPMANLNRAFPGVPVDHLGVHAADGSLVASQLINFLPQEHHDNYTGIIFQHDFAAGETSARFTVVAEPGPVPPFPSRVFARYVPERFDDFAWENDRIAHRVFGPALSTAAAGKSRMSASGVDVWCKRVRYLIVDRWYLKGHYHEDSGEGLDMYETGTSRGCGGTGVWAGDRIYPSGNWQGWKVLANGPIRAVFELSYGTFDAKGRAVSEVKRFTVDAGRNLDQVEDTFKFEDGAGATIAIGITRHNDAVPVESHSDELGWQSRWETFPKHGSVGCAVALDPSVAVAGWKETDLDQVLLVQAQSGKPIRYCLGAGWSMSGDFTDARSWEDYVRQEALRMRSPVTVKVSPL